MALVVAAPGNELMAARLAELTGADLGRMVMRRFPDGESYVRILSDVKNRDVVIVCTLFRPDPLLPRLVFAADAIRALGARTVRLVAPYLPYLRQDRVFHPGEALTATLFAALLERHFDGLLTVEPHLHRLASLGEIYTIPAIAVEAARLLAEWIRTNVDEPLIVGPDSESAQWVQSVAREIEAPWILFSKVREGDRSVRITAPDLSGLRKRTPVVIDDIVSSGTTVTSALRLLSDEGLRSAYCVAVHRACTARVAQSISEETVRFVTTNTVRASGEDLDVAPLIAQALIKDVRRATA